MTAASRAGACASWVRVALIAGAAAGAALGCSDASAADPPDAAPQPSVGPAPSSWPTIAEIDGAGGVVGSTDGVLEVIVPAGAFTEPTWVEVSALDGDAHLVLPERPMLARPLILRRWVEDLDRPRTARRLAVGVGSEAVALEGAPLVEGSRLVAPSWTGGRVTVVDRPCRRADPSDVGSCDDAPLERCVADPADDTADVCGLPCTQDAQCAVGLACRGGSCRVVGCATDADCPRPGEVCAGLGTRRACTPTQPPPSSFEPCSPETSSATRLGEDGARLPVGCAPRDAGCWGESPGCATRRFDAFEGLARESAGERGPWRIFVRAGSVASQDYAFDQLTMGPATEPGSGGFRGSRALWFWTHRAGVAAAAVVANDADEPRPVTLNRRVEASTTTTTTAGAFAPPLVWVPPRGLLVRTATAVTGGIVRPGTTILSFTSPFAGRARVEVEARVPAHERPVSAWQTTLELTHLRGENPAPDGASATLRIERGPSRGGRAFEAGPIASRTERVAVRVGDRLELSLGLAITQNDRAVPAWVRMTVIFEAFRP